ncbi:MAG: M48 family metallopeptidase [Tepidisphaeraceae bacterium]
MDAQRGSKGYRWGSCGKNGVVYFNWRLLQLPVRLVDYVIVHEPVRLLEHIGTRLVFNSRGHVFWLRPAQSDSLPERR